MASWAPPDSHTLLLEDTEYTVTLRGTFDDTACYQVQNGAHIGYLYCERGIGSIRSELADAAPLWSSSEDDPRLGDEQAALRRLVKRYKHESETPIMVVQILPIPPITEIVAEPTPNGHDTDNVRELALSNGYVALLDAEDYEAAVQHGRWTRWHDRKTGRDQARTTGAKASIMLHRWVAQRMGILDRSHPIACVDGNYLDCRRANIALGSYYGVHAGQENGGEPKTKAKQTKQLPAVQTVEIAAEAAQEPATAVLLATDELHAMQSISTALEGLQAAVEAIYSDVRWTGEARDRVLDWASDRYWPLLKVLME